MEQWCGINSKYKKIYRNFNIQSVITHYQNPKWDKTVKAYVVALIRILKRFCSMGCINQKKNEKPFLSLLRLKVFFYQNFHYFCRPKKRMW